MNTEILMNFLKLGLIDLQGSDEKLEKLETTSISLAKLLEADPSKTLTYALIALDPKAPEDDPVVEETISILEENWTTYSNTFAGTPIQVIRALLLQALVISAEENQQVAIAFVSITRNVLPHIEIGNEIDMWNKLVAKFESKLNIVAEKEWATPEKISVEAFSYSPPKQIKVSSADVTLNRETLQKGIEKASGPSDKQGQRTNGNTVWPNSNDGWVHQFIPFMTNAIGDVVDNALAEAKIKPIDLSKPLQELSTAVADHIDSTLNAVSKATIGLQRRTSLIWWKESLYSQSASSSYRKMPIDIAAAVMAFDLFNQVPTRSPASVSAFLSESISLLTNDENENEVGLADRIKEVQQSPYADSLRKYAQNLFKDTKGRGPLLRFLTSDLSPDDQQFGELTGLAPDTQISNSEWASWVFRELQAIRAVTAGENEDD